MDLIKDEDFTDLDKDFKFILYISFPTLSEALGYGFCKNAMDYANKNGIKNFEIRPRFSDQNSRRWDE
jgi:hypothetical protein